MEKEKMERIKNGVSCGYTVAKAIQMSVFPLDVEWEIVPNIVRLICIHEELMEGEGTFPLPEQFLEKLIEDVYEVVKKGAKKNGYK